MSCLDPTTGVIWEDSGASLRRQVLGYSNEAITQAAISSITYAVFDLQAIPRTSATQTGSLTPSAVLFDTLQTDGWTLDPLGYNFRYDAPATWFPDGGHTYRVELRFTPVSGAPFWVIFEVTTQEVLTS